MNDPKREKYYEVAENACRSIDPNLTIAGVDILDSEKAGIVVLEINCWPDLYDIDKTTNLNIFDKFAEVFYNKTKEYSGKRNNIN